MSEPNSVPRIDPLAPPYEPETAAMLEKWMAAAPEREPLKLFRTLARQPEVAARMGSLGVLLRDGRRVEAREREIVIHRTTARCGAEYEWGVHAVVYGRPLGLTEDQLAATVVGIADDPVWSEREALLMRLADELHDSADLTDGLWAELERHWSDDQLLELIVLAGWYRLISQILRAARTDLETWAPRFPVPAPDVVAGTDENESM
jgi:alkylhydroperoxidase family enzyme